MLVPEVWCRMRVEERDPQFLIDNGYLEKLDDFELNGRKVLASRLGYRITALFADRFLGRIFETPDAVFTEEMLRPEKQDLEAFAGRGRHCRVAAARRLNYFEDGSVEARLPAAAKRLLHIMARTASMRARAWRIPKCIRGLFTREALLASELVSRAAAHQAGA
jgi:hypothetical protein